MKHKLLGLLLVAFSLSLCGGVVSSCVEVFSPEVDFGDKTYVNDYSALVQQAKNLADKLAALNQIVSDNYDGIIVAIDANTNAIKAQTTQVSSDLQGVISALLDGFCALKTVVGNTGDKLVYAINAQGDLISLSIDGNGKLISAAIKAQTDQLVAAVNDKNRDMGERLDSLNVILEAGLAKIVVAYTAGDKISASYSNLNAAIKSLDATLFNGFEALKAQMAEDKNDIVYALNTNGEVIALRIGNAGELIAAGFEANAKEIADAINSQTCSLANKIQALSCAVRTGLADVKVSVGEVGEILKFQFCKVNKILGELSTNVFNGFKVLNCRISENGNKIVSAISETGEVITLAINENGELISASIAESASVIADAINDLSAPLADRLDALTKAITCELLKVRISMKASDNVLAAGFEALDEALGNINTSILEGFSVLKQQMIETGGGIIYAINKQGEVISLQLDETGDLLAAQMLASASDIVAAINGNTVSLERQIAAVNTAIQSGLFGVNVKLGELGGTIYMGYTNICEKLGTLSNAVISGYEYLGKVITESGEDIIYALNKNGETIAMKIDENGQLISFRIASAAEALVQAINNLNDTLDKRLAALNKLIADGFANLKITIDPEPFKAIVSELGEINDNLYGMNVTLLDGFRALRSQIEATGNKIVYAIDVEGQLIALRINEAGNLISAELKDTADEIARAIGNQTLALSDRMNALNTAITTGLADIKIKLGNVGDQLEFQLRNLNTGLFDLGTTLARTMERALASLELEVYKTGDRIVYAIDQSGNKVALHIDELGNVISIELGIIADTLEKLIDALDDQNISLANKIDALNRAIGDGLDKIAVKIDGLTNVVSINLDALKDALGDNTAALKAGLDKLVDGMTALSNKVALNGDNIVTAMNRNGEALRLQIDASGKLVSASVVNGAADIVKAMKDQNASLEARFDALKEALAKGLADINVSLDELDNHITFNFGSLAGALQGSLKDLKDGLDDLLGELETINITIGGNGDKIVKAINDNGEVIELQLKANGELIDASIDDAATAIVNALGDNNASLEAKFDALNDALKDGLADVVVAVNHLGDTLTIDLGALEKAINDGAKKLKDGLDDLLGGLNSLSQKVDANGDKIVKAINDNGEVIKLQLKANGELIDASIDDAATAIVEALGDTNVSGEAKFDALSKALKDGLADVVVAVNHLGDTLTIDLGALEKAINDGAKKLKDGLDDILGGLTALSQKVDANGDKIVTAINENGELIQLQIKASGELIEAAIKANTADLKAALESVSGDLSDKIDAINTTVESGLGEIVVAIDDQTAELTTEFTDLSGKLGTIGTNILNGFAATKTNLENIEKAINGMRDTLKISIDANTEAILKLDTDLKASLDSLVQAVKTIGGKLEVAINKQGDAIVLALGPDGSIVGAINAGATTIASAIGAQTTSLSALLQTGNDTAADILEGLGTAGEDIAKILEQLIDHKVDLSEIIELLGINNHLLKELLAISDGVYLDSTKLIKTGEFAGKYSAIYLTPEAREAADKSSETEIAIASLLEMEARMTAPSKTQYVTQTYDNSGKLITSATYDYSKSTKHGHSIWKRVRAYEGRIYSTGVTITDSDNKTLVEVKAQSTKEIWLIKIHEVCSFRMIYGIKTDDVDGSDQHYYAARYLKTDKQVTGPDPDYFVDGKKISEYKDMPSNEADYSNTHTDYPKWYNGGATPIPVIFNIYNKETGVYIQPEAYIYCIQTGFSKPYKGTNSSNKWITGTGGNEDQLEDDGVWPEDIQKYTNDWLAAHPDIR
ncbi:MAG: hypothetical protein KBT00_02950 [Bacteroidales bacterium]|nr:hypothetical protein [Candidatus Cacconaster merdequi]